MSNENNENNQATDSRMDMEDMSSTRVDDIMTNFLGKLTLLTFDVPYLWCSIVEWFTIRKLQEWIIDPSLGLDDDICKQWNSLLNSQKHPIVYGEYLTYPFDLDQTLHEIWLNCSNMIPQSAYPNREAYNSARYELSYLGSTKQWVTSGLSLEVGAFKEAMKEQVHKEQAQKEQAPKADDTSEKNIPNPNDFVKRIGQMLAMYLGELYSDFVLYICNTWGEAIDIAYDLKRDTKYNEMEESQIWAEISGGLASCSPLLTSVQMDIEKPRNWLLDLQTYLYGNNQTRPSWIPSQPQPPQESAMSPEKDELLDSQPEVSVPKWGSIIPIDAQPQYKCDEDIQPQPGKVLSNYRTT